MTTATLRLAAERHALRLHVKRLLVGFTFCNLIVLLMVHPLLVVAPVAFYFIGRVLLDDRRES